MYDQRVADCRELTSIWTVHGQATIRLYIELYPVFKILPIGFLETIKCLLFLFIPTSCTEHHMKQQVMHATQFSSWKLKHPVLMVRQYAFVMLLTLSTSVSLLTAPIACPLVFSHLAKTNAKIQNQIKIQKIQRNSTNLLQQDMAIINALAILHLKKDRYWQRV